MIADLAAVETMTLFVEDLVTAREFYARVFARPVVYQDEACTVFSFENFAVNLLLVSAAAELVAPARVAPSGGGTRALLTIVVPDVDAVCEELRRLDVKLLNGPVDRPWGRRTAAFSDPDGNVWEAAQVLS